MCSLDHVGAACTCRACALNLSRQGEVAAAVRALGLNCEVEYAGLEGLPPIDVALVEQVRLCKLHVT